MAKIIFQKSGVTAPWTGDEESILELGEVHDLDLEYGCRMGNCRLKKGSNVENRITHLFAFLPL